MSILRKSIKAILAAVLAVTMLAGCGDSGASDPVVTSSTSAPTSGADNSGDNGGDDNGDDNSGDNGGDAGETRDLGGKEYIIGNWWANTDDEVISTTYQEALKEFRDEFMAENNFTIKGVNLCGWSEMQELCSSSIMTGTPAADVFTLDSAWTLALYKQDLFYPVNTLSSADFTEDKWNRLVYELMTMKDGNTYGFASGYEPRSGLFFNKRLFEEAGIDPDLPYDLQAADEWTWDEFIELCKKLTRDVNADGTVDTYAMGSFSVDTMAAIMYSNDAAYVKRDDDGKFYNATSESQFLEALTFANSLQLEGYLMPQPADSNWDWFIAAFNNGQIAMRVTEEYAKGQMADMSDDFGFVMFPKGPSGELTAAYRENVLIIPSSYSEQEAENILFAYNLWSTSAPGYDRDEAWMLPAYTAYRDERAVDETLTMMYSGEKGKIMHYAYVAGFQAGDIAYHIWDEDKTPAEMIETVQNSWNAIIGETNVLLGY